MKIDITLTGLGKVQEVLSRLSGAQARDAYAKALNDTAFKARKDMQAEMQRVFDKPTPFILRSPRVFPATADNLQATVAPTYASTFGTTGGKIGVDPQQVLQAQEFGGRRRDKRAEKVLQQARILPAGMQIALPKTPFPGSDDGRGNFRGPFLVKLLSYLQAFGEQGYRSNVTQRSAARRRDMTVSSSIATRRQVMLLDGWEFFVSQGRGSLKNGRDTSATHSTTGRRRVWEGTRRQNLAAGVWARKDGALRPVIVFTKPGNYKPLISMQAIATSASLQDYLARRLRFRIREAAGV